MTAPLNCERRPRADLGRSEMMGYHIAVMILFFRIGEESGTG